MKIQDMKKFSGLILLLIIVGCQSQTPSNESTQAVLENPFVHSVYFWFKEDMTEEKKQQFYANTEKLREIEVVKALYTGKPANTTRPIVERSYDFAVIVHFENLAAHDVYQQHPIHLALLESGSPYWEKVMITDVE